MYRDVWSSPVTKPYMAHRVPRTVWGLNFCPFEDVLGVGHGDGFTSMLIPGPAQFHIIPYDFCALKPFPSLPVVFLHLHWQVRESLTLMVWMQIHSAAQSRGKSGRSKPCWRKSSQSSSASTQLSWGTLTVPALHKGTKTGSKLWSVAASWLAQI